MFRYRPDQPGYQVHHTGTQRNPTEVVTQLPFARLPSGLRWKEPGSYLDSRIIPRWDLKECGPDFATLPVAGRHPEPSPGRRPVFVLQWDNRDTRLIAVNYPLWRQSTEILTDCPGRQAPASRLGISSKLCKSPTWALCVCIGVLTICCWLAFASLSPRLYIPLLASRLPIAQPMEQRDMTK